MNKTIREFKKYFFFFPFLLVVFLIACSTKKNTVVSRAYHNVTAHYNGYFNARERIKEGSKTLAESHEDHYDRLLSIFKYSDDTKAKTVYPDMDEAIKKTSIVIQHHSMTIGGKERCRWIPYNYLVLGKAQFYKHDYWASIETFQYIASTYREKKQRPARYEAVVYLIQSFMELGKMADAEYMIDFVKNEKEFPKKLKPLFQATVANFFIQKKEYRQASVWLDSAAHGTKVRADRIRYTYILAQLYQKTDSNQKAFALYQKVIKMNPDYEMAFNAKINRARSFDVNNTDAAEVKQELIKMLRDVKNIDYLDQIYYALAGISERENDIPQALRYLEQSVNSSTTNTNQKGLSYLEMGEIYFKQPDYRNAQKFYDSAAAFISTDYPDYTIIQNKKINLGRLIKNLNVILEEDSMLALASLLPAEREARVDAIIKAEEEEAEKLKQQEEEQKRLDEENQKALEGGQQSFNQPLNQQGLPNSTVGGQWYFYNQSALSFGFTEFVKKWGNRKLEDNWRRINKQSEMALSGEEEEGNTEINDSLEVVQAALNDSIRALNSEKRKIAYLEKIPVNASQKEESNGKILEAYYNAGVIYKEQLANPKEASGSFETLLKRYPENKYKLATWYNLYRVYLVLEDSSKANYYKDLILNGFPDSEYARIITNPNYYKDAQRKTAIAQVYYENTYRAYLNQQYTDVIKRKADADSMFPASNLSPKFAFLKAMAVGKTETLPNFVASLNDVITNFPKDTLSVLAREILAKINGTSLQTNQKNDTVVVPKAETALYNFNLAAPHSFIIIINNMVDANALKNKIANFNELYFSTDGLKVFNSIFDKNRGYIQVKTFDGSEKAIHYLSTIQNDQDVFSEVDDKAVNLFVISDENFNAFRKDKDLEKYLDFFKRNYE